MAKSCWFSIVLVVIDTYSIQLTSRIIVMLAILISVISVEKSRFAGVSILVLPP